MHKIATIFIDQKIRHKLNNLNLFLEILSNVQSYTFTIKHSKGKTFAVFMVIYPTECFTMNRHSLLK